MRKIFVANWKMELSLAKSLSLLNKLKELCSLEKFKPKVILCPDFLALSFFSSQLKTEEKLPFYLGAQNSAPAKRGAFTGSISPFDLRKLGAVHVILGHSERRKAGESSELIRDKIKFALNAGLKPIVCLGENYFQHKNGQTKKVIRRQLDTLFSSLSPAEISKIIIAYEPLWAIGSGQACQAGSAGQIHSLIKNWFEKNFQFKVPVLYGGSVNSANADDFWQQEEIDGLLVGGASLKISEIRKICNYC